MIDNIIAPIVVGIIVGFVLLFGQDVKDHFLPEQQVEYKIVSSNQLLGPKELGRRDRNILGKDVEKVHLSQVFLKNTGKKAIDELNVLISVNFDEKPKLYRVFYTTEPSQMFGKVSFLQAEREYDQVLKIDKFVENTSITASIISSEANPVSLTINKSGVDVKDVSANESTSDLLFVALISALAVLVGRLLIDLLTCLVVRLRGQES